MRTLFGLLPFYGGDGGPMDQMVKATLASVGPSTIDVRNEAGDTLLILACQHGCEVCMGLGVPQNAFLSKTGRSLLYACSPGLIVCGANDSCVLVHHGLNKHKT